MKYLVYLHSTQQTKVYVDEKENLEVYDNIKAFIIP